MRQKNRVYTKILQFVTLCGKYNERHETRTFKRHRRRGVLAVIFVFRLLFLRTYRAAGADGLAGPKNAPDVRKKSPRFRKQRARNFSRAGKNDQRTTGTAGAGFPGSRRARTRLLHRRTQAEKSKKHLFAAPGNPFQIVSRSLHLRNIRGTPDSRALFSGDTPAKVYPAKPLVSPLPVLFSRGRVFSRLPASLRAPGPAVSGSPLSQPAPSVACSSILSFSY